MKIFVLVLLLLSFRTFGQPLTITPINDSVFIATTYQVYGTELFPANSMYVVTQQGVVLIDTPWDTTQVLPLLDSIQLRHNQPVVLCIATHFHEDRTGGFNIFRELNIPTWSSALTKKYCIERHFPIAAHTFLNDTTFTVGSVDLETFYPGAGHAPDNIVIWFPKWQILYGGCFIKSTDSPTLGNMADADIVSWANAVALVKKRYKRPDYVIPGHQQWGTVRLLNHTQKLVKEALQEKK
jgi:metallo-beta-lactamase class B